MSATINMDKVRAAVIRFGLGQTRFTEEKRKKDDKTPIDAGRRRTFKSHHTDNPYRLYNNGFGGSGGQCD